MTKLYLMGDNYQVLDSFNPNLKVKELGNPNRIIRLNAAMERRKAYLNHIKETSKRSCEKPNNDEHTMKVRYQTHMKELSVWAFHSIYS